MGEWIDAKKSMPKNQTFGIFVRLSYPSFYQLGCYDEYSPEEEDEIEYWMPLPDLPELSTITETS